MRVSIRLSLYFKDWYVGEELSLFIWIYGNLTARNGG